MKNQWRRPVNIFTATKQHREPEMHYSEPKVSECWYIRGEEWVVFNFKVSVGLSHFIAVLLVPISRIFSFYFLPIFTSAMRCPTVPASWNTIQKQRAQLTLAIQRRSGEITIRDIYGSREVAEVSEGVNVSLRAGRVHRRLPELPLIPFLQHNMKTKQFFPLSSDEKRDTTNRTFHLQKMKRHRKSSQFLSSRTQIRENLALFAWTLSPNSWPNLRQYVFWCVRANPRRL